MQDGEKRMATYDTKAEILTCLDRMTRELTSDNLRDFTTARIAEVCHVSRSLASQYLNELVRKGQVVKINGRPVVYLHKHAAERYFQVAFDRTEYNSMQEVLTLAPQEDVQDFDKAIGFELSYGTCIDHLKSAIKYPPHGIPAILVGEHGTGKRTMAELSHEYGVNQGILSPESRFIAIDCASYESPDAPIERDVFGGGGVAGAVNDARGGVVFLGGIDHLPHAMRELILRRVQENDAAQGAPGESVAPPRFLLATNRPASSDLVKYISRFVPVVVSLPRLADRGVEERTSLALHYLRIEGRRVGADVQVSRGALRALVNTDFKDNIDGLRACITNCCASAYLNREDEILTIQTFNLPSNVIANSDAQPDDDQLISGSRAVNDPSTRVIGLFQRVIDPLQSLDEGAISFTEFFTGASMAMQTYGDYMNFESQSVNPRIDSYERLVSPVIEEVNRAYGIELTRRISRSIAQSLFTQLWGGLNITQWRRKNVEQVRHALEVLARNMPSAATVAEQVASKTKTALGMALDELSRMILFIEIGEALKNSASPRDYLGIIVCHGYATATSIADAADRILHTHVFEAIDMTYDQEVTDIIGQLTRLLNRFSHAKTIAILVDMGSLEQMNDAISGLTNADIHIVNNVSTGLAIEVGSALAAHRNLDEVLDGARESCMPHYSIVAGCSENDAVVFCSESGIDAADKIRRIVQNSLPGASEVQLVTCDYSELVREGDTSVIFRSYRVRAIVGTMDPGVGSVPFVGLEDILYQGSSDALDRALFIQPDFEAISKFHSNLLRNLTLRNVIESITILNPEMLYIEADRAVKRLVELTGEEIDPRRKIGVYVHLCGLIERLVTKNFVDTAPDTERFVAEHGDFIRHFREAFVDMTQRYRVEIPISEIAYVHHMLHVPVADTSKAARIAGMILEDE